jgi:hypothetical protein
MAKKVTIELTPYNTLAILSFLREYVNDETKGISEFQAINDAVDEYEKQVYSNISDSQIEDAIAESEVNDLIGKHPEKKWQ